VTQQNGGSIKDSLKSKNSISSNGNTKKGVNSRGKSANQRNNTIKMNKEKISQIKKSILDNQSRLVKLPSKKAENKKISGSQKLKIYKTDDNRRMVMKKSKGIDGQLNNFLQEFDQFEEQIDMNK